MPYEIVVNTRTVRGKAVKSLRHNGVLPGVIYGHNQPSRAVEFPLGAFLKVWNQAGEASLITVKFQDSNDTLSALIQDVQKDPVDDTVLHVDFHQVDLHEKIITQIPLTFEGVAPAVKELGAVLVKSMDHLEVECLPTDLVSHISVDCSALKTLDDSILVKHLNVPAAMNIRARPDEIVATVQMPRAEKEEEKAAETKTEAQAVESVEVSKKGKEHGQEGEDSTLAPSSARQ